MFRVLTKALIRKGEEILLLKRKDGSFGSGLWDIPGGKLEFGELPIESLEREIFEETSLKVKVIRPISISSGINETKTKQYITIVFLCDYQGGILN
ncbi:NUDIX domain-containing protein [Caloranaerobacter azorensis]|uniref:NUDIX domain-containing protein n=1 Tax=Caloranaerobacter azorensis TaxID=116090 RepID=A0A6P1Y972_9FIRM|nr:NUDIX domain-containing protein [Caloranaerobacter azorensis]QIB25879.1 NUDIX domain-containing protein [Caloranaerobacter azorensis]